MLNLNGCLRKAGIPFSTLWSKEFTDPFFRNGLREWIRTQRVIHDISHVHDFCPDGIAQHERELGTTLARQFKAHKAILGVFDEGCMGMMNAIIEDSIMNPCGFYKERLSQSALYAAMHEVSDQEASAVRHWLDAKGLTFKTGPNEEADLTDAQILLQCKMYIAVLRIARLVRS